MTRAVLQAWLPWLAAIVVCFLVAWLLLRWNRADFNLRRLWQLHRDEGGAVQSLSFVLTLPFFIMVVLLIFEISQIMIGIVVVHYSAYAAARSASVWIPARLPYPEHENCIGYYAVDPNAPNQVFPVLDPDDPNYGPGPGGLTYVVAPAGIKYNKIRTAAVIACMPISPSRSYGFQLDGDSPLTSEVIKKVYGGLDPNSHSNAKIPQRLDNKLAYSLHYTDVQLRFYHKNEEPPLTVYGIPPAIEEFDFDELGWQDRVTVKVTHKMAMLPGPGRLLAGLIFGYHTPSESESPGSTGSAGSDFTASASPGGGSSASGEASSPSSGSGSGGDPRLEKHDGYYTYTLQASITMGIEGEKLVIPYAYDGF